MSALHTATTIFIDFENAIVNTDIFVCEKLYITLLDNKDVVKHHPLHGFFEIIDQAGLECLPKFSKEKKTINPLREIADPRYIEDNKDISKSGQLDLICDEIYDNILSYDYTSRESWNFKFSSLADSLVPLLKDDQLEKLYVYVKNMSIPIHKSIYEKFNDSDKVIIVTGDKGKFFSEYECDVYIMNNIMDITLLPDNLSLNPPKKREVMLLDNYPNKELWDTYFSDKEHDHTSVCERYNADYVFIDVH